MELKVTKLVLVGARLIIFHTVDQLVKEDVKKIFIYDNFTWQFRNLRNALKDPRVKIFEVGGDVMQTDILEKAM
jgi:UDP-glucose 4-epimerase